jgi:hypothetical protein
VADWPVGAVHPNVTIHPWSLESIGAAAVGQSSTGSLQNLASAAWTAANRAIYIPFAVTRPLVVAQLYVFNGATVSGNSDCGVYDAVGTRVVSSGSTAQAGTTAYQVFNVTDTLLGPGVFYLALALNNTTGTVRRVVMGSALSAQTLGMAMQETAFPLPATATLAALTVDTIPMVGLTGRGVV